MKWLACLALVCGCTPSVTEALVTVSTSGLQLGVDIDELHMAATDIDANYGGFDQTILLCPDAGGGLPGCRALPLSVVLYPGPRMPDDRVRVLVEGLHETQRVLADVATLTFTRGARQQLDFVLYGTCLNRLDCSGSDAVCDADGQCTQLQPKTMGGSTSGGTTMGTATTGSTTSGTTDTTGATGSNGGPTGTSGAATTGSGGDLAILPSLDMFPPGTDLARTDAAVATGGCGDAGQPCCGAASTCKLSSLACYNGTCQECGGDGERCCPDDQHLCDTPSQLGCDSSFHCSACGGDSEPCCSGTICDGGSTCIFGTCQAECGSLSQLCCSNDLCVDGLTCMGGVCSTAACTDGNLCCDSDICASGDVCFQGSCSQCGAFMSGGCLDMTTGLGYCTLPYVPDPNAGICGFCDWQGGPCCGRQVCLNGLVCDTFYNTCN